MQSISGANQPDHAQSLKGLRVLLVEDSWIVAASMKSLLEMIGVEVVGPYHKLQDAVAAAKAAAFDVAVMDLDLQGQLADGLVGSIHKSGRPVVIVSGHDVKPATAAGAVVVMTKPIRAEHLLKTLRKIRADLLLDEGPGAG
jgi:CheY-like chemotaxis protein